MKQALKLRNRAPWLGALLVLTAALALAACDSDVNVTGPQLPDLPPVPQVTNTIWVHATLSSVDGHCLEFRLLYDHREIAHSVCRVGSDCAEMQLAGFAPEGSGRHTVELQVVRQEPPDGAVVYRAAVELAGGSLASPGLTLGPTNRTLRAGESVAFEFDMP